MLEHSGYDCFPHCVAAIGAAAKWCVPARFPPARGNQVGRPRAAERQLASARSRDDQPGGSRPQVSNPETGLPSHRPPKIACDSVVDLKGDRYLLEDGDLGRVATASADD